MPWPCAAPRCGELPHAAAALPLHCHALRCHAPLCNAAATPYAAVLYAAAAKPYAARLCLAKPSPMLYSSAPGHRCTTPLHRFSIPYQCATPLCKNPCPTLLCSTGPARHIAMQNRRSTPPYLPSTELYRTALRISMAAPSDSEPTLGSSPP